MTDAVAYSNVVHLVLGLGTGRGGEARTAGASVLLSRSSNGSCESAPRGAGAAGR